MKQKKFYWAIYDSTGNIVRVFKDTEDIAQKISHQFLEKKYIIRKLEQKISNRYPRIRVFQPKNPQKYTGRHIPIARSSWEYDFMKFLDTNENVLEWSSESVKIHYVHPIQSAKEKRVVKWWYYPDFFVRFKTNEKEWYELIEIKPYKQTLKPVMYESKSQKQFQHEMMTYLINLEKWKAAQQFCKEKGWIFRILTEKDLY